MGCSSSKNQDLVKAYNEKFFVGLSLFVNLKGGEMKKNYKELEALGKGAQGEVKLVIHLPSEEKRAMKKIVKSQKNNEAQISYECQLLMYMDHPNIVKIYELYQDEKHFYIIYEYLHGGELYQKLIKNKQFSEKVVANYVKQILSAISYCHQNNIIHRDIKPQNILLESDEQNAQLKLIDFGFAKKKENDEESVQGTDGTPYYVAPEIISEGCAYQKSDVWSCGIMTLQLLTGKLPYGTQNDPTKICKMISDNQLDFSIYKQNQKLSPQCKSFLDKILQYDLTKRSDVDTALLDPWIQNNQINKPLDENIVKNLQQFHVSNKLQQAILQLLTNMIDKDEKQKLTEQFKSMDKDGNGKLSKNELQDGYYKIYRDELKAASFVEQIFKYGDFNHSETLEYTEFLVAASKYNVLVQRDKLENAFKLFDIDGNGQITIRELQQVMAGAPNKKNEQWRNLIRDFDQNGDGQISHQEFIDTFINRLNQQNQ